MFRISYVEVVVLFVSELCFNFLCESWQNACSFLNRSYLFLQAFLLVSVNSECCWWLLVSASRTWQHPISVQERGGKATVAGRARWVSVLQWMYQMILKALCVCVYRYINIYMFVFVCDEWTLFFLSGTSCTNVFC